MEEKLQHNIFLVGFMGSGKSYWGRIWATSTGCHFYDLDAQIERAFKMTVEDIFKKHKEEKFRELERYHLRKFENKKNYLLSCGGGTPCFFDNLKWMKEHGSVIYLKASAQYILDRVMDETAKRPLLKDINSSELLFFIQKKLKEREPFYMKADHILEVDQLDEHSLDFMIKKPLNALQKKSNAENPRKLPVEKKKRKSAKN